MNIDEIKKSFLEEIEKAKAAAQKNKGALVIGSDQVLVMGGEILSKAVDAKDARAKLMQLRGREHLLISSVAVVKDAQILWTATENAALKMHKFSEGFIDSYISKAGDSLTHCVGCYALEGLGAQLFESVEGDYFTVLGLPLLKLLGYLREEQGVHL